MKRIVKYVSLILGAAVVLSAVAVGAFALGGTAGTAKWTLADGVLTVNGGDVPDYTASTAPAWAKFGASIEKIVIGEGVTRIGERAFEDVVGAVTVDFGAVQIIGKMAFSGCVSLGEAVLPETVTEVGDFAFAECAALAKAVLPAGLTRLGEGVFESCPTLKTITGGGGAYTVLNGAIVENGATLYRYPPAKVADEVTLPDTVTAVANGAFRDCVGLKKVVMPAVTAIGDGAFYGCASLESVDMPAVKVIGRAAFYGCGLSEVTLPETLTDLGDNAFAYCESLRRADFGGDAPTANAGVFDGVKQGFTVMVQAEAEGFGETEWLGCPILRHGNFSGEVSGLAWSLDSVTGIMAVTGDGAVPDFANPSDAPWYPYRKMIREIVFDGVTAVGANSFRYSTVESLVLPESVEKIGAWAFSGCEYLEKLTVLGTAEIGECGFFNCIGLDRAELRGVSVIGKQAFAGCESLRYAFTGEVAPGVGEYAFDGTDAAVLYPIGGVGYENITVAPTEAYFPGDANGDGKCNLADASHLLKYIAKWESIEVKRFSSDVNGDGALNIFDVSHMLKHIAGWTLSNFGIASLEG